MSRCRFGWYERGRVVRHVPGRQRSEVPENEPSAPASLLKGPGDIMVVEAAIGGTTWYGRLMPKKEGLSVGIVLLFERPQPKGI